MEQRAFMALWDNAKDNTKELVKHLLEEHGDGKADQGTDNGARCDN